MNNVVNPMRADVFAVFEESGPAVFTMKGPNDGIPLREALPRVLGARLKMVGLSSSGPACSSCALLSSETTTFVHVKQPTGGLGEPQWVRLKEAWKLMEIYETKMHFKYDIVIKLRFDCTPLHNWNLCASDAISSSNFRAIHACTDHVFWG